jgi:hypothetical protein
MSKRRQMMRQQGRQLDVDEEAHSLGRLDQGMIALACAVLKSRSNVPVLQIRIVPQNIRPRRTSSKHIENVRNANAQAANARTAAIDIGVRSYAVQFAHGTARNDCRIQIQPDGCIFDQ